MTRKRAWDALKVMAIISGPAIADVQLLDFSDLHGWPQDDHAAALSVFRETCADLTDGDWPTVCALSDRSSDARTYFETFFRPVLVSDEADALFTGYYEPELFGSRKQTPRFNVPLYRQPEEASINRPWFTRAEIEANGVLKRKGLEIVWIEDPVDKFFLQIQGSGRIKLAAGGGIRVGYGGKNGHPYRSVGQELVRRGVFEEHQVSAQVIRNWVKTHPGQGEELLRHNPSYVFFREVTKVPADKGPLGAMNRSITTGRTLAIDPEYVPLGAPVWLEKEGRDPIRRLMVAQDTGSAIKGAQRGDIFFGTGAKAGEAAGKIRDSGRMVILLPIHEAIARIGAP